jgi:hypothetical protein
MPLKTKTEYDRLSDPATIACVGRRPGADRDAIAGARGVALGCKIEVEDS